MGILRLCITSLCLGIFFGCSQQAPPQPAVRPVQTLIVHRGAASERVSLSGQVQAQNQINFAFRIGGRLIERKVSIDSKVVPGQLLARLESQDADNRLRTAEAELAAAQAALVQAGNNEARFRALVDKGMISRVQFDDAQQQLDAARSRVSAAEASVQTARDNVSYTELRSDVAGTVTAKGAEPGEVVRAGQMIVRVAQEGGKDAVFNVPAPLIREAPKDPTIIVALSDDPGIRTTGHVREVSPQADPTTGTYIVRVDLDEPPPEMRLGATVVGSMKLTGDPAIRVPGTALTESEDAPAVWVVDGAKKSVSLVQVRVLRYDAASAVIASGLNDGDIVVTAGVHALRPGQKVRLPEQAP
ncbi:MAG: efflux RND transporter periplasmic adaptor subunit [Chromatiaceae bacterium]